VSEGAAGGIVSSEARLTPLRESFAWTVAGNAVYAAGQWAILSLFAKLGSVEMLGLYALAVAVANPVAMLAHLNLRATIATDVTGLRPARGYFAVRLAASAAALVVTAAIALSAGYTGEMAAAIVLVGVALAGEALSDACHGFLQRRERLDVAARSMMLRAGAAAAALGAALWITRRLVWAVAALAVARLAVALLYDRPRAAVGQERGGAGWREGWPIFRTALPLGVVLMLVSLNTNVPRYAIERWLGAGELGAFAAVASFVQAGAVAVQALGQTATPRLARYFAEGDLGSFRRLGRRIALLGLATGAAGVAGAAVFGRVILRLLYRPEYAAYSGLLVKVMAAGALGYVAVMLGYTLTSARSFRPQAALLAAAVAVSALASWTLIPTMGLDGAAAAMALAAGVQIAGSLWILHGLERRHAS